MKKQVSKVRSEAMKKSWAERRNSPMREQARKRANALGDKISRKELKAKDAGQPKFWILWAPSSHKPPTIRFGTLDKVREVAGIMVNKYHCEFFVMESLECHKFSRQVEVVKYAGKAVKEQKVTLNATVQAKIDTRPYYPNMQGQSWDQQQDSDLIELWMKGNRDLSYLAEKMGRSQLAIEYRLEALGIRPRGE